MGALSIWHILIVAVVVLLLFGGKFKMSDFMGDAAKGIKAFKDGIKDEDASKKQTPTVEDPNDKDKSDPKA